VDAAIADFDKVLVLDPHSASAYDHRARARAARGEYEQAIADHIEAVYLSPHEPAAYSHFARLWATCPDPKLRNGRMAVELATKACMLSAWEDWNCLLTLAMAQAALGNFDEAGQRVQQAIPLAPPEMQAELRATAERYQANKSPPEKA
jgi:serine/threonine-protein kinase